MDTKDWDDLGRALEFVLMVVGLLTLLFLLLLGSLTFGASTRYFPDSWKSCTEMKPVPGADDGSEEAVCVDDHDQRYDIVYRSIHKKCTSTNIDVKTRYQHFLCEEQWELMLRPVKEAASK